MGTGQKIMDGLKDAVEGNFAAVTIEGQRWTRGPTMEEVEAAQKVTDPYRKQISDTPELLSLLYDIDLVPEQIRLYVNATRMVAFCELFKLIPEDRLKAALSNGDKDQ